MAAGRPSSYDDSMILIAQEYIDSCSRETVELATMEGLAGKIGVHSETLLNWAEAKTEDGQSYLHPEFFATIKDLKDKQKNQLINDGMYGGKEVNSTMAIFLLKANHGMIETERKLFGNDGDEPLRVKLDTE